MKHRFLNNLFIISLLVGLFAIPGLSSAGELDADDVRIFIDEPTIARGYTIRKPSNDFLLAVFPNVLDRVATITLKDSTAEDTKELEGWTRVSKVFEFDIVTDPISFFKREVIIELQYASDNLKTKRIYFWDRNWQQWRPLRSVNRLDAKTVRAFTHLPYSKVAVFEEDRTREGIASWYRDGRVYTASSNDYPVGSFAKVTNVDTGASVVVKIVSTGPFVDGRVIDLERTAFAAIANPSAGVAKVVVEPTEEPTVQRPSAAANDRPAVTAPVAIVWDPADDRTLYDKNADTPHSIASITKLMTAIIFLESDPDWDRVITIAPEDTPQPIQGVRIAVYTGDTITVRDLFEAMLTGSANNAAYALARSTGLSREEFVARMNNRARGIGMTHTTFVEPSGLDSGNAASARDVAKLVQYASNRFGLSQATIRGTDTYTILNRGETRTIKNPIYLAGGLDDKPLFIGKTGYLDEARYTLGVKVRNGDGEQRVVVVLGSSSRTARNRDVARLVDWSLP